MPDQWEERDSQDNQPYITGKAVFRIMDSEGIPLDSILEVLRERGAWFDVRSFVEAAHDSKNFQNGFKLYKRLTADPNMPDRVKRLCLLTVVDIYKDDPPLKKRKLNEP